MPTNQQGLVPNIRLLCLSPSVHSNQTLISKQTASSSVTTVASRPVRPDHSSVSPAGSPSAPPTVLVPAWRQGGLEG